jgi:hypothetical protein
MAKSERPRAIVLDTLGRHAEHGCSIMAYCEATGCHASLKLDLATLIWTSGLDFPSKRLPSRLRYPKCGSRNLSIRLHPWTKPTKPEAVPLTDLERAHRQQEP